MNDILTDFLRKLMAMFQVIVGVAVDWFQNEQTKKWIFIFGILYLLAKWKPVRFWANKKS